MATLAVLKFNTPEGASQMLETLAELQKQQLITIVDAATVSWPADQKKPKTKQMVNTTATGALSGTFWGMLFGLIFFVPFIGAALGAAIGAISGHFADYGIDDDFINTLKSKITPGTSGLFLLGQSQAADKVAEAVKAKGITFEIVQTNLSHEQENKLRDAFAE